MKSRTSLVQLHEVFSVDDISEIFLECLITNLSDSHHMRFSQHFGREHNVKSTLDFIEKLLLHGGRYFQVMDNSRQEFLGSITIRPHSSFDCEAGILVFKSAAGRGVGSSVWMELPKILKNAGYRRLIAGCHRDNMAMRALMRKLGMSQLSSETLQSINELSNINMYFALDLFTDPAMQV
jgi:RimJ/RimL family protein N-acetyltransferase